MLKIKKVGIELELSSLGISMLPKGYYKNIKIVKHKISPLYKDWLGIGTRFGITYEYYKDQIEFNIEWDSSLGNKYFKLLDKLDDSYFHITNVEPAYVGTHIHLILYNDNIQINYRLRHKKMILFNNLLLYYHKIFKYLLNINNQYIIDTAILELNRLISNHNILIYFDHKFFNGKFTEIRSKYKLRNYYYTNGKNKPKYQPIVWSSSTGGKPFTLEIRYIPNIISIDRATYNGLIKVIKKSLNQKGSKFINIQKEILKNYEKLCILLRDNVNNYRTGDLLSLKETRDLLSNYNL